MKNFSKLTTFAAALAIAVSASAQFPQALDLSVVYNSNLTTQIDRTEIIYFAPQGTDNTDQNDLGDKDDIPQVGNYASPFTINGSGDVVTIQDAYPMVDRYKVLSMGIATKNPATISITALGDTINFVNGLAFVYLQQLSTGVMFPILNDTATFNVPANDDFVADFQLIIGTYVSKQTTSTSCSNASNGAVHVTNPFTNGWDLSVYDANAALVGSYLVNNFDTLLTGFAGGNYTVVTGVAGVVIDSSVVTVASPAPIVPSFTATDSTSVFTSVNFTNTSSNAILYSWDFGDGSSDNVTNPSYAYSDPGTYTVTMIASNGVTGCQSTATATIVVDNGSSTNSIEEPSYEQEDRNQVGSVGAPGYERVGSNDNLTIGTGSKTVTLSSTETIATVQVLNMNGQLVSSENFAGQNIALSVPQAGIYIVSVAYTNGTSTTRKVMVNE